MCERSGEAACEEPGSKQLTRRSKVAVAAQLSLCLWSTIFSVESQLKTEMKFLLYLVAAWEREKMHCVGELKNFCWGVLLEADRISAFFGFYFHWLLLFFLFFFLFSFFAEKWTQISRATATVWLIPSPFSQILRITSLFVISKTDLKGIVSVSRPYTFSYRNCGFIYLFFNKRKHGIKQTNKQTSSRQLHNLFGAKPRRFNHNCATIHRRDRKLETSQCPGQSPRHRGTPIGTPRAAFCSRGQAERVLSRAKAFSLSID